MSDSDVDDAVTSLPQQTLKRIDQAFDRAISESRREEKQRPRKRRRIEQDAQQEPELAGGFLLDNADAMDIGGGFVLEDNGEETPPSPSTPIHIPLSLIPRALQLLDLDPSGTQVLSVFKNAASSWSEGPPSDRRRPRRVRRLSDIDVGQDGDEDAEDEAEQVVSRRDWRAVCAALIPSGNDMGSPLSSVEASDNEENEARPLPEEESDSGSSAVNSGEFEESDTSSDEYIPESKGKSKAKGKGKAASRARNTKSTPKKPRKSKSKSKGKSRSSTPDATMLTSRQQQDTLSTFALFFPSQPKGTKTDLSGEELVKRRLTIKEIANAAASIKEKITVEEIVEMLTYFSPSSTKNNPSMSFQEFQQMMIESRLA